MTLVTVSSGARLLGNVRSNESRRVLRQNGNASINIPLRTLLVPLKRSSRYVVPRFSVDTAMEVPEAVFLTSRLLTASLWAAVVWMAFSLLKMQEKGTGSERKCETCNGTGKVECYCTRWSDGDRTGCATCRGSLLADCPSCRGGGTAVPIQAKVYIRSEKDYF